METPFSHLPLLGLRVAQIFSTPTCDSHLTDAKERKNGSQNVSSVPWLDRPAASVKTLFQRHWPGFLLPAAESAPGWCSVATGAPQPSSIFKASPAQRGSHSVSTPEVGALLVHFKFGAQPRCGTDILIPFYFFSTGVFIKSSWPVVSCQPVSPPQNSTT